MKLSKTKINVKYSKAKKKAQATTVLVYRSGGSLSARSNSKYITVTKNWAGIKIKVAKGTPKGTYKVAVTAAGNSMYQAGTKTITITVK